MEAAQQNAALETVNNRQQSIAENTQGAETGIAYTKISKTVINLIFSVALLTAAVMGIMVLINYLSTGEAILFTPNYGGEKVSLFEALRQSVNWLIGDVASDQLTEEILTSFFGNFDIQIFANLGVILTYASAIMFFTMILLSIFYNIIYLVCTKQIQYTRSKKTMRIANIVYAVLSYLSIITSALSTAMITIALSPTLGNMLYTSYFSSVDSSIITTITKIFLIITYVVFLAICIPLLVKKVNRISPLVKQDNYICLENIGTYFAAIVVAVLPAILIILTFIAAVIIIALIIIKVVLSIVSNVRIEYHY